MLYPSSAIDHMFMISHMMSSVGQLIRLLESDNNNGY